MSNIVYKLYTEKFSSNGATNYIGKIGDIFYDPDSPTLRVSDGSTLGGVPLSASAEGKQDISEKDQPNGYAGLDANGNILANVTSRTGLTSSLVGLTAPKGELAVGLAEDGKPEAIVQFGDVAADNKVYGQFPVNGYNPVTAGLELDMSGNSSSSGFLFKNTSPAGFQKYIGFYEDGNFNGGSILDTDGAGISLTISAQDAINGSGGYLELMAGESALANESVVVIRPSRNNNIVFAASGNVSQDGLTRITRLGFFEKAISQELTTQPVNTGGGTKTNAGGTPVLADDTFTGGIGTTGYTIGQVVRALKLLGLIAE